MKAPQKILGVYGGMGPAASAEFMRLLTTMAPAQCDQEHPIVYLYSNAQTPDHTDAFYGRGVDTEHILHEGLDKLCDWGADLLAVPCNTAHIFINKFRSELRRPLIHIVEATVDEAIRNSPDGCWIIATSATLDSGIYTAEAARRGYQLFGVDEEIRGLAMDTIMLVKADKMKESAVIIEKIAGKLWSIRRAPIMLACTELPLAWQASSLPADKAISSLVSLSRACIRELYKED